MAGTAEIAADVFDIFQPSPVSLKQLSAIAVSLEIWRGEVMKHRCTSDDALKRFDPKIFISSRAVLPDLPSVIYDVINRNIVKFGASMAEWLSSHHNRVFYFYYDHQNRVLKDFDDFVCDYFGGIDFKRTAERMMLCDRFDERQKFIIACTYFFEDDIRRLWPSVSNDMNLNGIDFSKSPQLYYWTCCLRNKSHELPFPRYSRQYNQVEQKMLFEFMPNNRPSVEYFWNRIPSANRSGIAFAIFKRDRLSFVQFILQKLDDQEIDEFVNNNKRTCELFIKIGRTSWYDNELILSTWLYIRNVMNAKVFTNLVLEILRTEIKDCYEYDDLENPARRSWLNLCCEIWTSAPKKLKRSAAEKITSSSSLSDILTINRGRGYGRPISQRQLEFLTTFLSDVCFEDRRRFWFACWIDLIEYTGSEDLAKIMTLCFENEDDITQFKENVMANSDKVLDYCRHVLIGRDFDYLNGLASFLFSEAQAARNFKQQSLRSAFIDVDNGGIYFSPILCVKEFNEFIDDAFANVDLAAEFKHQFISSPVIQRRFSDYAIDCPLEEIVKFINTFTSTEETVLQIKEKIFAKLKVRTRYRKSVVNEPWFISLLSWCLGSDEEVAKFKMNYS